MTELALRNLRKTYGEIVALNDLSLTVKPGEIYGFVGSNGAGKSTAMRITMGLLAKDSGTIKFGGKPIDFETRRTIGYMPEERGLYPKETVAEQLIYLGQLHGMSKDAATEAMRNWTEKLSLADRRDSKVQDLSLGNQQRVQLSAALIHTPQLLILDEPFSGLDPVAVDIMVAVLREEADRGVPIIFSSHQLDLVQRLCDRVGIIAHGEMRAEDTVYNLRSTSGRALTVTCPTAPRGWADQLAGVLATKYDSNGVTRIQVDADVDTQTILHAALSHGPVKQFTPRLPDLTELFREVVS
ncbi:MAG TPA: ABC transporter ATP-binding protein [Corynebacteriales bacterium]|nr:ABC transporter ATP-binding protein [Mycobacteriales bacterium]